MAPFASVFYRSACGRLRLHARDQGPRDAPLTVLCLHGLTRNSADFEWLAARLANRYRVISADQRGRGLSDPDPDPTNYRPDVYVGDMLALLDHLGIDRVVLIGTSLGGLMSMILCSLAPQRVRAMVLNDVGPEVQAAGLDRIRQWVGKLPPPADWADAARQSAVINGPAFPDYGPADWMEFAHRTYRGDPGTGRPVPAYDPAIAQALRQPASSAVPPDLWQLWDTLPAIPILIVHGLLSDILSALTVCRMAQRHGATRSVSLSNRGHAPMLDEPPAVAAIYDLLTDVERTL